ncbi:MAG TPA: mannose-1-phosphate guanylyltransferase [Gemmatimonadaceae bacterium]|nr:mannose-1-phosphate guanylyltransferase [Gemmatimonadaceae bacterium]
MSRWVVVLAGGIGSRFWPLSTPERPKQLLPLVSDRPLLRDTLERVRPLADAAHTLILTNASLVPAIAALAPEIPRQNLIAEPQPAGTAAALAWAAHRIAQIDGPEATMLSVHADWAVGDAAGFRRALVSAAEAAERHASLVTVGIVPSRPDPGFGYVQPAGEVAPGVRRVQRFVEKPDAARAAEMCADGYLWNSGIFVWRVGDYLADLAAHTPEVAPALAAHPDDLAAFFAAVTPISVDVGVMERSTRVLVIPGDFGWDDIGVWGALRRVRERDAQGNAMSGDAHAVDARNNVVHAESGTVVLYGVDDLVVVTRDGLTVVTTVEKSHALKDLLPRLPAAVRDQR